MSERKFTIGYNHSGWPITADFTDEEWKGILKLQRILELTDYTYYDSTILTGESAEDNYMWKRWEIQENAGKLTAILKTYDWDDSLESEEVFYEDSHR